MQLTADSVSVSFGERHVLNAASADFRAGETVAIVGPSGSGKSTLLSVLAGVVIPDSGGVTWSGAADKSVEWLVQSTPLLPRRTVIDNVRLSALVRGEPLDATTLPAVRAMRDVGILPLARSRVSALSGGERQRVAIARAMTARTSVLIADEPTASLDPSTRALVTDSLEAAARRGCVVVVATHDPYVADRCTRVLHLTGGELLEAMPA